MSTKFHTSRSLRYKHMGLQAKRIRSVVNEFPTVVSLTKTFSLLVYLTAEKDLEEPAAETEPKLLTTEELIAAVDMIAQARRGF